MPSIESHGYPLVFGVADSREVEADPAGQVSVCTEVRALEGMQKEALVRVGSGRTWRMVSDEGPYLDGTDLAPFPLAYFAAGMQFSLLSRIMSEARTESVGIASIALTQDALYSMEGSFLRGDAEGGAMPVRVEVTIESDADSDVVAELVRRAVAASGAHALMRDAMVNVFALTHNGQRRELDGLPVSGSSYREPPSFESSVPDPSHIHTDDILTKTLEAEKVHGVEGGAGSSLQAVQKRTLHVHGEALLRPDGLMETDISLFKPIGSSFRFVCDETPERGGTGRAPSPLAYLGAGVGFCYMTQLGRYAHIKKKILTSYSLIQQSDFVLGGTTGPDYRPATAEPFDTHVFMESDEADEVAADFVRTGERTCFLHAAMRGRHASEIQLRHNDAEVEL